MRATIVLLAAGLAGGAVLAAQMRAGADPVDDARGIALPGLTDGGVAGTCTPSTGPDVIVGRITGVLKWGTVGAITAYSLGGESCNIGDVPLQWDQDTNNHPVIGQNVYRLRDGRFEHVGLSWLKHGFGALADNLCCTCIPPGSGQLLGVGCSDLYGSALNGDQDGLTCTGGAGVCGGLGPRFEVNATTGDFAFPYGSAGMTGDVIYKRLQVHNADVDPAQNAGATYWGEMHYVTLDDAAAANHHNNASYCQLVVAGFSAGGWNFNVASPTVRELPALYAWQVSDPSVTITTVDDGSGGRFILGQKVSDNGDGTWHYEYALHNLNSHRSARAVSIPVPPSVTVTNEGFHDVDYHSGDGTGGVTFDGTDWPVTVGGGVVSWSTASEDMDPTANALRWATLYNFRFDADAPPTDATATIGLYLAGTPADLTMAVLGPGGLLAQCPWDLDGDGEVATSDFFDLIALWGTDPGGPPDFDGNGDVDISDFFELLGRWGPCA